MATIVLETRIAAPPERCFDLSLSVDLHLESTAATGERVAAGRTSGVLGLGEEITWEARHLGRTRRLTTRISGHDRLRWFRDEQVEGPFRSLRHDHRFDAVDGGTLMRDRFEVHWFAPVDRLVLVPHLRRLLVRRNELIRQRAERPAG